MFSSRISHAYLFSGPESIGKKAIAQEFVRLLNCQNPRLAERPCNVCSSCLSFQRQTHPDFVFIEPELSKKDISIAQIRDLILRLSFKPFMSGYKAGIIDQAHLMNAQSQNCILKTLEEPKGKTILILISEHPEALFFTVRSRLQEIKFYPLSGEEIKDFFVKQGAPEKNLEEIVRLSLGRPGRALEFLKDKDKIYKEQKQITELLKIIKGDLEARFKCAEAVSKRPLKNVLAIWLKYLRQLLIYHTDEIGAESMEAAGDYSQDDIIKTIKEIEKLYFLISTRNVNQRLALEALMLNIPTNYEFVRIYE